MKQLIFFALITCCAFVATAQPYTPTKANLDAREWFTNAKFGLFIHWGPFSIPGSGEWVMNNRNITVKNYTRLMDFFNPIDFDAAEWVRLAKAAGMQYMTLITRHHDGFSLLYDCLPMNAGNRALNCSCIIRCWTGAGMITATGPAIRAKERGALRRASGKIISSL